MGREQVVQCGLDWAVPFDQICIWRLPLRSLQHSRSLSCSKRFFHLISRSNGQLGRLELLVGIMRAGSGWLDMLCTALVTGVPRTSRNRGRLAFGHSRSLPPTLEPLPEVPLRPHRPCGGRDLSGVRRGEFHFPSPPMKPHPRPPYIRKTTKWGGAAVTVLLVGVLVASRWWSLVYVHSSHIGWSGVRNGFAGGFWCDGRYASGEPGMHLDRNPHTGLLWSPRWRVTDLDTTFFVPLWIPATLTLAATVTAWRLDTRARRRDRECRCSKCNYDRTGITPSAVCPECGAAGSTSPCLPPSP